MSVGGVVGRLRDRQKTRINHIEKKMLSSLMKKYCCSTYHQRLKLKTHTHTKQLHLYNKKSLKKKNCVPQLTLCRLYIW